MALKVQSVLAAWKEFNLHSTQQKVDETAAELTTKQDESDVSRKRLVELSKEFKKNSGEDVRKLVAPLLKSFQAEIDNLTKRSKFAESAFLSVYKTLVDITDPIPSLEYCIGLEKKLGKFADLEIENKNLRDTLREYNEEFKEIRNQDVTIKSLKEKLKAYEETLTENVSSITKDLEKELQIQYAEKERLLQETHNGVMRRLQDAEARAITLQQTLEHTQSELFEFKSKSEEFTAARSAEVEILSLDIERSNHRALRAEKELAKLQEQFEQLVDEKAKKDHTASNSELMMVRSSLEVELSVKDNEICQLVEDIKKLQSAMQQLREDTQVKIASYETQLEERGKNVEELQVTLESQSDYQELKRELAIIKSVEFGASLYNNDDNLCGNQQEKPLEFILMEKNKTLQNENTVLKQANLGLTKHISESNHEVSTLRNLTAEQKLLISQLESDLASMQSFSSLYRGEGEGCPSVPEMIAEAVKASSFNNSAHLVSSLEARDPVDGGRDSSASMAGSSSSASSGAQLPSLPAADLGSVSAAESLLTIVSAQRERFKARNEELEAELAAKSQQISMLQNESDLLRTDNIKLYEKIRFLQSYRGDVKCGANDSSITESRYSNQYEESLDPFASFSRQERLRRYGALSPFEKITLSLGRFILSNKTARTVTFIYSVLVHCLVFLVLYKLAHTESCKRELSTDCVERFRDHMQHVHGEADFMG